MSDELDVREDDDLRGYVPGVAGALDPDTWMPGADRAPKVDVWIAYGLRKRWRVVSIGRTYGEWDELINAEMFINLLVDGNPDLERLR